MPIHGDLLERFNAGVEDVWNCYLYKMNELYEADDSTFNAYQLHKNTISKNIERLENRITYEKKRLLFLRKKKGKRKSEEAKRITQLHRAKVKRAEKNLERYKMQHPEYFQYLLMEVFPAMGVQSKNKEKKYSDIFLYNCMQSNLNDFKREFYRCYLVSCLYLLQYEDCGDLKDYVNALTDIKNHYPFGGKNTINQDLSWNRMLTTLNKLLGLEKNKSLNGIYIFDKLTGLTVAFKANEYIRNTEIPILKSEGLGLITRFVIQIKYPYIRNVIFDSLCKELDRYISSTTLSISGIADFYDKVSIKPEYINEQIEHMMREIFSYLVKGIYMCNRVYDNKTVSLLVSLSRCILLLCENKDNIDKEILQIDNIIKANYFTKKDIKNLNLLLNYNYNYIKYK